MAYQEYIRPWVREVEMLRERLDEEGMPYDVSDWKSHQMQTTWWDGDDCEQYLDLSSGYGRLERVRHDGNDTVIRTYERDGNEPPIPSSAMTFTGDSPPRGGYAVFRSAWPWSSRIKAVGKPRFWASTCESAIL